MDNGTMIYICPVTLLILFLYVTTPHLLRKLRNHPPSPFLALPFIGHLYLLKKPFHRSLSEISKKYGPILSLQLGCRSVLLISSPVLAEECLTKHDVTFANRPSFLFGKHFGYNFTSLPWSPYGDHWRNLRKISTIELLSAHRLNMFSHVSRDEILILVRKLANSEPGGIVEMKMVLFEFIFNVLTGMICGQRFYGTNIQNTKLASTFRYILEESTKLGTGASILDMMPFMKWFGEYKDTEKKIMQIQERRDSFMQTLVDEYRTMDGSPGEEAENKTMAQILLSLQKEEPKYYTDEMIRNLLLVLIQAGATTSADTLEWAFSHLLANPHVLTRAQAELDNVIGKDRLLNEADLVHLPYLRGIINETLRLHPAAPLLLPHESSQDCVVGGFYVPKGTILYINVWDMQRNPIYWDEPEKFKPERFQDFEGVKSGCKFMPFGFGRRACPGDALARRHIALSLGSLIQCFDFEKAGEIDMTESSGVSAPKTEPLTCKCNPRSFLAKLLSEVQVE